MDLKALKARTKLNLINISYQTNFKGFNNILKMAVLLAYSQKQLIKKDNKK